MFPKNKIAVFVFLLTGFHSANVFSQAISPNVAVDQFGYNKTATKIAVLRSPKNGFDSPSSYQPGASISLKNSLTNATEFSASPALYKSGITDPASGDKIWWFDFSSVQTEGTYYVLDETNNARSATFIIADTVYKKCVEGRREKFLLSACGLC